MRDDMVLMLDSGWSLKDIAAFFGVSVEQVMVIITGKAGQDTKTKKLTGPSLCSVRPARHA